MNVAPEHVAPTVTLGIGGVRIRFEAAESDLRMLVPFPQTRFVITDDAPADCLVRVRTGEPDPGPTPTFVSGGPWELYPGKNGGDRLAIFAASADGVRAPVIQADLTPNLDRADLIVHSRYAPDRKFPVHYPLDEYLTARLLARRGAVILHASAVSEEGPNGAGAYVFAGHSGAGKSTMVEIAERNGLRVLSDDRTVLSVDTDAVFAAGTPWHGSYASGCPDSVPVRAIFLLEQAGANGATAVSGDRAFAELMVRTVRPMADRTEHVAVVDTLETVVQYARCAVLQFTNSDAVLNTVRYFAGNEH